MAKDKAPSRRYTRSGAPKHGSVAKRQTAVEKRAASHEKAAKARANPKTGKQRREANTRARQAMAEENAKENERFNSILDEAMESFMRPFKEEVLPYILEDNLSDAQAKKLISNLFHTEATQQEAFELLVKAREGNPIGEPHF
jgi:hypothetical protein